MKLQTKAKQHGVGLIEVLIALVIFALGVVGMAGLQLRTMSVTIDSTQRSYVVAKSQDIADRIRSSGIEPRQYLGTYNASGDYCATPVAAVCADNVDSDVLACTPAQMFAFDLYDAFCEGDDGAADTTVNNSSLENQVAEWQAVITCEFLNNAGVMVPTTACDEFGATVNVEVSWFARSVANDASAADPERDSMTLSFVP